jgi:putative hemolysin
MKKLYLLVIFILMSQSVGMLNPADVYCHSLGYEPITKKGENGSESCYCRLPNNVEVDAWEFLLGRVATEYGYCARSGYDLKVVNNSSKCVKFLTGSCAVCMLKNGTEVEVTDLMNLSFKETTCGDGHCGTAEDFGNCPRDCPSGEWDDYCDGVSDGKCDPNCLAGEDPDCK